MNSSELKMEMDFLQRNFKKWLEMSNLSEQDLLKKRIVSDFKIISENDNGYRIVMLGYLVNGTFIGIGEPFVYLENDLNAFQDLSLLLLFIANKLDNENEKGPEFEKRPNYFFYKVKTFIKEQVEYYELEKN